MDPRMMRQWLADQAKKAELTTTKIQQKRLGIAEDTGYIPFVDNDPELDKALRDKGVIVKKPNPSRAELEALAGRDRSNFSAVGPLDRDSLKMNTNSQRPSRPSPAPQPQIGSNQQRFHTYLVDPITDEPVTRVYNWPRQSSQNVKEETTPTQDQEPDYMGEMDYRKEIMTQPPLFKKSNTPQQQPNQSIDQRYPWRTAPRPSHPFESGPRWMSESAPQPQKPKYSWIDSKRAGLRDALAYGEITPDEFVQGIIDVTSGEEPNIPEPNLLKRATQNYLDSKYPNVPDFKPEPKVGIIKNLLDIKEGVVTNNPLFQPPQQMQPRFQERRAELPARASAPSEEKTPCQQKCNNIGNPDEYRRCMSGCGAEQRRNSPVAGEVARTLQTGKETQARMDKLHSTPTTTGRNPYLAEGLVQQAEANSKAGMHATAASTPNFRPQAPKPSPCEECRKQHPKDSITACKDVCGSKKPITEQLSPHEERIAQRMKPALANMIDQYGEEKGHKVFYGTVRNLAKKGNQ